MNETEFEEIHSLNTLDDCKKYMKVMTDFYYDVIYSTSVKPVHSISLNDARTWLQMMFSKGVYFTKALDGFDYDKGFRHLNRITDHTVLYSLVRDMYESYISFRLIYTHPKTQEQKDIVYYLFVHAGLQERFCNAGQEVKDKNPEWTQDQENQMKACEQFLFDSPLYKSCPKIKNKIDNALRPKVNKYRYRFTEDDDMDFVSYEKDGTAALLKINSSVTDGMYHYFSQMAHPSYAALDQFSVAYKNLEEGSIMLASTATRYALTIMSLYIREYALLFPEVNKLFSLQDKYVRTLVSEYGDIVLKYAYQRNHQPVK